MSTFETKLRSALSDVALGKDMTRNAGEGVWANYVRAACYEHNATSVESLANVHKEIVAHLEGISPLSKEEKNSLRSAKSVVGKALARGVDVWQRDESGAVVFEDGNPMPKGKSELQEAKSDFERMLAFVESAQKKWDSDSREVFSKEELTALFGALATLTDAVLTEKDAQ